MAHNHEVNKAVVLGKEAERWQRVSSISCTPPQMSPCTRLWTSTGPRRIWYQAETCPLLSSLLPTFSRNQPAISQHASHTFLVMVSYPISLNSCTCSPLFPLSWWLPDVLHLYPALFFVKTPLSLCPLRWSVVSLSFRVPASIVSVLSWCAVSSVSTPLWVLPGVCLFFLPWTHVLLHRHLCLYIFDSRSLWLRYGSQRFGWDGCRTQVIFTCKDLIIISGG